MAIIRHTPAEGTFLDDIVRGDGVWEIAQDHGFIARRHRGVFLPNTADRWPRTDVIDALAADLRGAGHAVELDITYGFRPAAEAEADYAARSRDRVMRKTDQAHRIARTADGLIDAADAVFDSIPLGQPGDFPARRRAHDRHDRGMRLRGEAQDADRTARAAADNLAHRWNPRTVMRRLDELGGELRSWRRALEQAVSGTMYHLRCTAEIDRCTDAIAFWAAYLDKLAETGEFTAWTREHFRRGDRVNIGGHWWPVTRINAKSLTVEGAFGSKPVGYSKISGRRRNGWQLNTPDGGEIAERDGQALDTSLKLRETFLLMGRFDARTADERQAIARALAAVLNADANLAAQTLVDLYDDTAGAAPNTAIELAHAFVTAYRNNRKTVDSPDSPDSAGPEGPPTTGV